jgi:class 3 adenylate cyclase
MDLPETRYVSVSGAQVAYQVAGSGPEDLVYCYALGGHTDLNWQVPILAELLRRLIGVRRLVAYDRRGSGASDPVLLNAIPTWEEHAEDMTAVLDAVGSERTAVMAIEETGPIAILFAAMHPERVSHLILVSTCARYLEAEDYPIGVSSDAVDALVALIAASWGSEDFLRLMFPSYADDAEVIAPYARILRASATPRSAAAQYDYMWRHMDVRDFLPLVQAPTLILHPADCPLLPVEHGRYLAEHIPNARLIEWPGADVIPPDMDKAASDVIEFLTGERPIDVNRVLTTVLFTDIVGSTERAASLGDQRWHALLDAHDRAVRDQVRRFKGREIKTTGDGFLVAFDGPARAIRCAEAINTETKPLGVDLRMGLHTGECEVRGEDLGGLAVHIAARIGALATSEEVLVSSTLHDLVIGSGIEFTDRGEHDLKGVPGHWKLFAVRA